MYPLNSNHLGRIVLNNRVKKKMTQQELAERIKVSPQFLGRIEKELVPIPEKVLLRLINELKIAKKTTKMCFYKSYTEYIDGLYKK